MKGEIKMYNANEAHLIRMIKYFESVYKMTKEEKYKNMRDAMIQLLNREKGRERT